MQRGEISGTPPAMQVNTLILGAGAAGLFCASRAGSGVLVVDHAKAPGEKIRISGGGRCNFTNIYAGPENFLSQNPHYAKSALSRFAPWDFISLVEAHGIKWHEKTLGQLFCDTSAKEIIAMLLAEMDRAGAQLWLRTEIGEIEEVTDGYRVTLTRDGKVTHVTARKLVVATGGKSIPKMGATGLAYRIAGQFGLSVTDTRAALVPFTFTDDRFKPLAGVATPARVTAGVGAFDEALLFTHRGLSGPAVLQASSYWDDGMPISVNLLPETKLFDALRTARQTDGRKALRTVLAQHLPARLVEFLSASLPLDGNLADQSDLQLEAICSALHAWELTPSGTEGYRTAEVTLGGVDTAGLNSRSMAAKTNPNLYFIGECVDVTGWLGGYNFQWAWASAHAAGTDILSR